MVEEQQLVAEEQGGFRKGRGCRDQLMTFVLLGQLKAVSGKGCLSVSLTLRKHMTELIEGSCGGV